MADLAKRHTIPDVVVMTDTPWLNMGCIHHRMPFRRYDSDSAEGATVIIGANDCPSKTLIPGFRLILDLLDDFLHLRHMEFLHEFPAVFVGLRVDRGLFNKHLAR